MNLSGYKKIEYAVNKRSSKDRWILLMIGIFSVFSIWSHLVYNRVTAINTQMSIQLKESQSNLNNTKAQLNVLLEEMKKDPVKNLEAQKDHLSDEVISLDKELKSFMDSLVDPKEMLTLLRTMLEGQTGLSLLKMENEIPTLIKVIEPVAKDSVKSPGTSTVIKNKVKVSPLPGAPKSMEDQLKPKLNVTLYKHSLEMTFSGTFFKVVDYLKQLEGINKKIIWDSLTYTVKDYPVSEVKLTVMTISTNEGWLGV